MESYEYNKPYEKSLHRDHRRGLRPLGRKTQSGLELDQFCMAENLDEPKYESCCKGIMDIHDLLQQAKELCKPDTTYTIEVIHCGKAMEWLENQKTL